MKIISLCSGSKGNCSLILHHNTILMVDCGATQKYIKTRLAELNISLDQISALLITHDHSDHIRSLKLMKEIPWYGCCELEKIKLIKPFEKVIFQDIAVTPLPLSHDAKNTVGYLFETKTEKLVYMTDTGYVPKRLVSLISNAEMYFIESNHDIEMLMKSSRPQYVKARIYSDQGHLCNEDCAKILKYVVGPSTHDIILAHLSEEANDPKLALDVVQNALKDHALLKKECKIQAAGQFEICSGGSIE